jgi:phosphatidylserine/phosphatidylglycerophosphate/cardiolipin synthase-like enzyme
VSRRGVWSLTTERLDHLRAALQRRGDDVLTEFALQQEGFDPQTCGTLVGLAASAARVVVEAVLGERRYHPRPELELVWTGREGTGTQSRDTGQVLRQMFERAEKRVLVAGFAFYEASTIFAPLHERAMAGVDVEFFIHIDGSGKNPQMSHENFLTYTWPWRDVHPRLYHDTRAVASDNPSTMHAKCVVVDDREVLITSANFTERAHHTNVELGAHIIDDTFAKRVSGQWRSLVATGYFSQFAKT